MNVGNDVPDHSGCAGHADGLCCFPDPSPTYNVKPSDSLAGVDIPARILVGNQQAERSSTEDQKYFNGRCQSRRGDLSFEIEDFSDKLIDLKVIDPVSEKTVIWDDLNEQTGTEKLANAKTMAKLTRRSVAAEKNQHSVVKKFAQLPVVKMMTRSR